MIMDPMSDPSGAWIEFLSWLFLLTNTGRIIAYLPQIRAAWTCPQGARSVSLLTWSYFAIAHLAALLYAIYVLRDSRSTVIFAGNLTVTLCLVMVLLWRRQAVVAGNCASAKLPQSSASRGLINNEQQATSVRVTAMGSET
jgi:uncharacterized protein with PQ loop repeat